MSVQPTPSRVSFTLSEARHGWIGLDVQVGDAEAHVACSDVYDPFHDLVGMATQAARGFQGALEIDEEGVSTCLWLTREPGSFLARLRIFRPDLGGRPETMHVDATVDALQFAAAFHDAFAAYVESYDPRHWRPDDHRSEDPPRSLAEIDYAVLACELGAYGLAPGRSAHGWSRDRYEAELGPSAVPMLPGTEMDRPMSQGLMGSLGRPGVPVEGTES